MNINNSNSLIFGTGLVPVLESFLESWIQLAIDFTLARKIVQRRPAFTQEDARQLRVVNRLGKQALRAALDYSPRINQDIWQGMVLAAQCVWLCSSCSEDFRGPIRTGFRIEQDGCRRRLTSHLIHSVSVRHEVVYVTVEQGVILDSTLRTAIGFLLRLALHGTAMQGGELEGQRSPTV